VLNWGIGPILWLQGFSPLLDLPFKLVTFLGNKEFLILFFPILYWCVDRRVGMQVAILFLISAYLNAVAHYLLDTKKQKNVSVMMSYSNSLYYWHVYIFLSF